MLFEVGVVIPQFLSCEWVGVIILGYQFIFKLNFKTLILNGIWISVTREFFQLFSIKN